MRDVRRKIWLIACILVGCFWSTASFAEVKETPIGIGFSEEQPTPQPNDPSEPIDPSPNPAPEDPPSGNTILPVTMSKVPAVTSWGTLPQTGEQRQARLLQVIGMSCVIGCFWLFLFIRLKEEDANE